MAEDVWILGIHMTKFGKHPTLDIVDLAAEATRGALADGGVKMKDMGIIAAGNQIVGKPYEYGGGHGLPLNQVAPTYDCSSSRLPCR